MLGKNLIQAASGAAGAAGGLGIEDVFSTWLYTGNGSTQTITNGIDLAGEGGMVWAKVRNTTISNNLIDTIRGGSKSVRSDLDALELTDANMITSFNSDGFSIGSSAQVNQSPRPYASWTFRKAPGFFDVVTYTGDGVDGRAISHNLGSVPGCIIVKKTNSTGSWWTYHRSLGTGNYLLLNSTTASAAFAGIFTSVTSTTFVPTTNNAVTSLNNSGDTYVAYLFAHDEQIFGEAGDQSVIKCGSFTCDGSGNVGTVNLGWEPQYILAKKTNGTQNWWVFDTMRGMAVNSMRTLNPNVPDAELNWTSSSFIYPTATGFAGTGNFFGPNAQVVYIAIRRGPMKTPTDATKVFSLHTISNNTNALILNTGFNPDLAIGAPRNVIPDRRRFDTRLTSNKNGNYAYNYLQPFSTNAENTTTSYNEIDFNKQSNAVEVIFNSWGGYTYVNTDHVNYFLGRAPGFFDVVAYTGTTAGQVVNHNLTVKPELLLVKARSTTGSWFASFNFSATGFDQCVLNTDASATARLYGAFITSEPTASQLVFTGGSMNTTGVNFIAYLFATLPGISKVGSYTGTGTTLSIDCGFTSGARFVLIKRTDSTGDWYVWDTARGIVAGNDPYLLLNSTAAEVTSTDYIDPLSSGFQISSTAPAAINANGGSFIYLAIA